MRYLTLLVASLLLSCFCWSQCPPPVMIPAGPVGLCQGGSVTLTVVVNYMGTVYQWCVDSAAIAGATASTYTTNMAGTYTVRTSGMNGCMITSPPVIVNENALPIITASANTGICNGGYDSLFAGGGSTYAWAPATGLSCTSCSNPIANPAASTVYTVTGTDGNGCVNTTSVSIDANKVWGNITFNNTTPDTTDAKVWLITFDQNTNLLAAVDSTTTCNENGAPYYEFNDKPNGNYLIKAMLLYGNYPGSSGYIPTYASASLLWSGGATIAHSGANDGNNNIDMQYGIVPAGPGFIGGDVLGGANKHTTGGTPVDHMLIYLRDANNNVLTYTYTDANGYYSFSNIANGTYSIYPEAINYATTPFTNIVVNNGQATGIDFRQHDMAMTITPVPTGISNIKSSTGISIFPNPATGIVTLHWGSTTSEQLHIAVKDVAGREICSKNVYTKGTENTTFDLSRLANGMYVVTIKGGDTNYTQNLTLNK